ncbi:hypothetical protein FGRMN_6900 [Fusarium graminum]|nr:hypothetical protein FGRMN_6900 [Fusarium graminum]
MGLPPKMPGFHLLAAETRITILQLCNIPMDIQSFISASPHMFAVFKPHRCRVLQFWFSQIQTPFDEKMCLKIATCVARKKNEWPSSIPQETGDIMRSPYDWRKSLTAVISGSQLVVEVREALGSAHQPVALPRNEEQRVDILVFLSPSTWNTITSTHISALIINSGWLNPIFSFIVSRFLIGCSRASPDIENFAGAIGKQDHEHTFTEYCKLGETNVSRKG